MLNPNKHTFYKSIRPQLKDFSLLDRGGFFCKKMLLFLLLLFLPIVTKAQFFVSPETTVSIDVKETVYVDCSSVYLLSEINNKGTLILDHTHTLYSNPNENDQSIASRNTANLKIKKTKTLKNNTLLAKSKSIKPKAKSETPKSAEFFPQNNNPYNQGAMYSKDQTAIAFPSTSYKLKKNTILIYFETPNFEQFYLYTTTITAKQNHTIATLRQNRISLKNNSRPPPFFCS